MIVSLFLVALFQDGAIRTALAAPPHTTATVATPVEPAAEEQDRSSPRFGRLSGRGSDLGTITRVESDRGHAEVPAWALSDAARWETSQCGATGDDACRRQARNRLAMARAGLATNTPSQSDAPAPARNCRMVMRRSETGFGGSLTRICGETGDAEAALDRLDTQMRPVVEPCDRPAALETQESWIARCRVLTPR